jgi:superfamily II DNA or RNA helicase
MSTIFHSNYYAYELTRRFSSEKFEKLSQSLFNATVDLNPHQIEAALFAFRSPLSRGAILADEVGLGKTIEAGLIISQLWAERKRRILIILPAALREQWGRELLEKFFIASIILESKNFNQLIKQGSENPFEQVDTIVLCSYHFARTKATDILKVPWDLVVVDEAHRLRNVYRRDNKIARTLLAAIGNRPKVLLTATPLQNSLMELYGLVSFIDPHLFGSEDSFRSQYARRASEMSREEFQALRARVQPVCHRTLRRQADQRVFELLSEKFRLFDGVFGASDEVLGAIESGVDFEKRIHEIYQSSRTPEEIARAFDQLQLELEEQITAQLEDTRAKLLENFDVDVHTRLRLNQDQTTQQVTRFEEWLWRLTQYELSDCAFFDPNGYTFNLKRLPAGIQSDSVALGQYRLITHKNGTAAHHFRLGHPLAEHVLAQAKGRVLPVAEVTFRYDQHRALNHPRMSLVEQLQGRSGWSRLSLLTIEALEPEQHLVFSAIDDDDNNLDEETCERLFMIAGEVGKERNLPETVQTLLDDRCEAAKAKIVQDVTKRNQTYFEAEMDKLENWAEDLKQGLERELKELDREIKSTKKEARQASSLDAKIALHKKAKELERQRNDKRRRLFETQDEVDTRKDGLIEDIEQRLKQRMEDMALFTIRWCVR